MQPSLLPFKLHEPFHARLKFLFSTSGKLPCTLLFFTFQNLSFYTIIIFQIHLPTLACVSLSLEFHSFVSLPLPLIFAKTSWHKVLEQIQLANCTFRNNQSKKPECYSNIFVCHNVTQVYLSTSKFKFLIINISCAISSGLLHDKGISTENP